MRRGLFSCHPERSAPPRAERGEGLQLSFIIRIDTQVVKRHTQITYTRDVAHVRSSCVVESRTRHALCPLHRRARPKMKMSAMLDEGTSRDAKGRTGSVSRVGLAEGGCAVDGVSRGCCR